MDEKNATDLLTHDFPRVGGAVTHVVTAGDPNSSKSFVFLHGWPEDWRAFEEIMLLASRDAYAVAIDLPGVGGSTGMLKSGAKSLIARHVVRLIGDLGRKNVTIVGHDVGGQVAYACLRVPCDAIRSVVILSVVVPGVEPWSEALRNPHIWHFAFHNIPGLPEQLVTGKQASYFAYFYDAIAAHPEAIDEHVRKLYASSYKTPSALMAGFDWYRAFAGDAEENARNTSPVATPLLYMRGEKEGADIQQYVKGFRDVGVTNVTGKLIPDSGHFTPEEQPAAVWEAIKAFADGY